jgi:hypothetical protein
MSSRGIADVTRILRVTIPWLPLARQDCLVQHWMVLRLLIS